MKTFETQGLLEDAAEGYYVMFDHRENPAPRTETLAILTIRSYVIPVVQEPPSQVIIDNGGI